MDDGTAVDAGAHGGASVQRWRCDCGEVRGTVDTGPPHRSLRVVCHCRTCRAFAEALGREGDRLDAHGGTDAVAVSPAAFVVSAGHDRLAALAFSRRVLRWYAACCRTPLVNSPTISRLPYLSVPVASFEACRDAGPRAIDGAFGPPVAAVQTAGCPGGGAPDGHRRVPPALIGRTLSMLAGRWRRGEHRDSPLFDADGHAIARPEWLEPGERLGDAGSGTGVC